MRRGSIGLVVLVLVAVGLLATIRPGNRDLYPVPPGQPAQAVFLIDNGFHADIAVPRAALTGAAADAARGLPPGPWVLIGWGDASFFRASGLSVARAIDGLRALFRPGNSAVIRMVALRAAPDRLYAADGLTALSLSPPGFGRLLTRLDSSYASTAGRPILISRTLGAETDLYFLSTEHFSIAKMCNQWASQLLGAAGVPGHKVVDGVVGGLLLDLRLRAGVHPHTLPSSPAQVAAAAGLPAGG